MLKSKSSVFGRFTTPQRTPKGLVVTPNLPQLQNILTAMIRTSHMSVLCILGFLFKDANRIYKQTSLFTGGSSQSRTAINRATIYRLTVGLTTHIVAIGESNSGRLDGAVYGIRTRDICLEGRGVATTLILQNKVY